jgi:hypothetical protein
MPLAVDLDENLIQMPAPLAGLHPCNPAFSDLVREHRPEQVPPESDGFVAYVHATLVKQICPSSEFSGMLRLICNGGSGSVSVQV